MSDDNAVKIAPSASEVPKDNRWYALEVGPGFSYAVRWSFEEELWHYMLMSDRGDTPLKIGRVDTLEDMDMLQ